MEITNFEIKDIIPYDKNPRKNDASVDAVAESIKELGFKVPIVIDRDYVIVTGHTRYKAAQKLGLTTVPCIIADDLTEEQIKAYRLADNKVGEKSEWDFDLLAGELEGILDLDMELFGFDFDMDDEPEDAVDDDYVGELPDEPRAKLGQVYQLGNHRLMCGDSTSVDDVLKLMDGQQADLLITDPPYNVAIVGGDRYVDEKTRKQQGALTILNDKLADDKFHELLVNAFKTAEVALKQGAAFYVWYASREHINFESSLNEAGFEVRQQLIWEKNSLLIGRQDYQWKHEPCLYGWKEGASHSWYSDRSQTTVLHYDKPKRSDIHPTMKPIPLFDYQIKNSTKQGDLVLDLFNGSGTTIMACEQNGRYARCMELDPKYVDAAIDRWETFTGKKAVLVNE